MVTKDADRDAGTQPQQLNAVGYRQFRFSNQLILTDQTYSRTVYLPCNYDISELPFQNQAALAVDQNMQLGVTPSIFLMICCHI